MLIGEFYGEMFRGRSREARGTQNGGRATRSTTMFDLSRNLS